MWKLEIYDGYNVSWIHIPGIDNVTNPMERIYATYEEGNQRIGSRAEAVTWTDADDNLYLFAGEGYSTIGGAGSYDLVLGSLYKVGVQIYGCSRPMN